MYDIADTVRRRTAYAEMSFEGDTSDSFAPG
jgi:hypothetical protein